MTTATNSTISNSNNNKKIKTLPLLHGRAVTAMMTMTTMLLLATSLLIRLEQVAASSGEVSYSYDPESDVGPEFWKDIVMDNNQCGGTSNSPVALASMACTTFADYTFQSGTCTYKDYGFVINDHVEQANAPATNSTECDPATLEIPGVNGTFELLQFHVHMNSEHTMNGNRYGAELHMVHKQKGGDRLAVVGLFIQANDFVNNELFSDVLAGFDASADAAAIACNVTAPEHWWQGKNTTSSSSSTGDEIVNVYGLIPNSSTFFNYDGGLTTPPCSEVVEWSVADQPLSISVAQYNDLSSLILNYLSPDTCERATIASPSGSTSRPVQELNNRTMNRICPVGYVDDDAGKTTSDAATSHRLSLPPGSAVRHMLVTIATALVVMAATVSSSVVVGGA